MTDLVLQKLFQDQALRLRQAFEPAWAAWLQDAGEDSLTTLRYLVHTLKGSALGLDRYVLAEACHALETAWDAGDRQLALAAGLLLQGWWLAALDPSATPGGPSDASARTTAPAVALTLPALERAIVDFLLRTASQLDLAVDARCMLCPRWLEAQALLWDVLPHLLRNALTHGAEPSADRLAAGKPASLRVVVSGRESLRGLRLLVADDGFGAARPRAAADLWSGRGQGVAAVRAVLAGWAAAQTPVCRTVLHWRGRRGRGSVARISIFFF